MIVTKTRKWGNSIGVVLPKKELERLNIGEDEMVEIEIRRKNNPFRELYEANLPKIGIEELHKMRKEWESKYL